MYGHDTLLQCTFIHECAPVVYLNVSFSEMFDLKFVFQVPGGIIEDSKVLNGVMLNKDVTHPKMRRRIENPKILLLDCSLEYKKGESQVCAFVSSSSP